MLNNNNNNNNDNDIRDASFKHSLLSADVAVCV